MIPTMRQLLYGFSVCAAALAQQPASCTLVNHADAPWTLVLQAEGAEVELTPVHPRAGAHTSRLLRPGEALPVAARSSLRLTYHSGRSDPHELSFDLQDHRGQRTQPIHLYLGYPGDGAEAPGSLRTSLGYGATDARAQALPQDLAGVAWASDSSLEIFAETYPETAATSPKAVGPFPPTGSSQDLPPWQAVASLRITSDLGATLTVPALPEARPFAGQPGGCAGACTEPLEDLTCLAFVEPDPAAGALSGCWLVGSHRRLQVYRETGHLQAVANASRHFYALAVRPRGSAPDRRRVLAASANKGRSRTTLGELDEQGNLHELPLSEPCGAINVLAAGVSGEVYVGDGALLKQVDLDGTVTVLEGPALQPSPSPDAPAASQEEGTAKEEVQGAEAPEEFWAQRGWLPDPSLQPALVTGLVVAPAGGLYVGYSDGSLYQRSREGVWSVLVEPTDFRLQLGWFGPRLDTAVLDGLQLVGQDLLYADEAHCAVRRYHLATGALTYLVGHDTQRKGRMGPLGGLAPHLAANRCAALEEPFTLAANRAGSALVAVADGLVHLDLRPLLATSPEVTAN